MSKPQQLESPEISPEISGGIENYLTAGQISEKVGFIEHAIDEIKRASSIGAMTLVNKFSRPVVAPTLMPVTFLTGAASVGIVVVEMRSNADQAIGAVNPCPNTPSFEATDPFPVFDPTQAITNTITLSKPSLGDGSTNYICTKQPNPNYGLGPNFHNQSLANFVLQNNGETSNTAVVDFKSPPGINLEEMQAGINNQATCTNYTDVSGMNGFRCDISPINAKSAIPVWLTISGDKASTDQTVIASIVNDAEPPMSSSIKFDVVQSSPAYYSTPSSNNGNNSGASSPKQPIFSVKLANPRRWIAGEKRSFMKGAKCYTGTSNVKLLQPDSDRSKNVQLVSNSISVPTSNFANLTKNFITFPKNGYKFKYGACLGPARGHVKPYTFINLRSRVNGRLLPVENIIVALTRKKVKGRTSNIFTWKKVKDRVY